MGVRVVTPRQRAGMMLYFGAGANGNPIIAGLDTDAQAVISAMAVTPNAAQQTAVNTLVVALKSASVWTKLGALYVFAASDEQASLINWTTPSSIATVGGTPTFRTNGGWTGNGTDGVISTGIAWNAIPGVTQNDAHVGGYMQYGIGSTASGVGTDGASGVGLGRTAGNLATRINIGTALAADAMPSNTAVHLCASRNVSTGYDRYLAGSAVTAATSATSVAPVSATFCALKLNTAFATNVVEVRAMHAGAYLTAGEVSAISTAIAAYMVSVGTT